jgi:hypothetical protein
LYFVRVFNGFFVTRKLVSLCVFSCTFVSFAPIREFSELLHVETNNSCVRTLISKLS